MSNAKRIDVCGWKQDYEEGREYNTDCGHSFSFNEGGPRANSFKFCPYCGGNLVEVEWSITEEEAK